MTQHRRHGLELREGRWCSAKDLNRMRRDAEADGSVAIERFLRAQERCGHPIWGEHKLVVKYILRLAQEHFKVHSQARSEFDKDIPIGPEVYMEAGAESVVIRPWGGGRHRATRRGKMVQYEIIAWSEWKDPRDKERGWTPAPRVSSPQEKARLLHRFIVKDYDETESILHAKQLTQIIDPTLAQLRSWLTKRFKFYGKLYKSLKR